MCLPPFATEMVGADLKRVKSFSFGVPTPSSVVMFSPRTIVFLAHYLSLGGGGGVVNGCLVVVPGVNCEGRQNT